MSNGILPLLDEALKLLQTNHPKAKVACISSTARSEETDSKCSFRWYPWRICFKGYYKKENGCGPIRFRCW